MATLVYSDVDGIDRSFALGNEPITVGRAPECAIRSEDPRVSRVHARFFIEAGVLWVEDCGSANGIFVGPNRVGRAPVPTGEIILVGSIMIRLLPMSGTLPPPVGLHGTLATWLGLERKARTDVEEQRDALARRVGELHQRMEAMPPPGDPEAIRLRDEANARAAALESALAAVQDEVAQMRVAHAAAGAVRGDLEEALAARSVAEHAHGEAERDAQGSRDELDKLKKSSQLELELLRVELSKVREAKNVAETQAGMAVAEKLADADFRIADLHKEISDLKRAQGQPDPRIQNYSEQITMLVSRAEKAEKELAAAQIRAQGAERNLSGATAQAAKAETQAAQIEERARAAEAKLAAKQAEQAASRERMEELEKTVGANDAPARIAEARSLMLNAELTELKAQFETRRDRIIELEQAVAAQVDATKAADDRTVIARTELAAAAARIADADKRTAELKVKLDGLASADVIIAAATKTKDDALARATAGEQRATASERRAEDAEKRANAADTMAKAMAKDVAEALRRAAESDSKAKANIRELAETRTRAEEFDKQLAEATAAVTAAQERVGVAEAELARVQKELGGQLAKAEQELAEHVSATQRDLAARNEAHARELRTRVEETQQALTAKHEEIQQGLNAQLEMTQRELSARLEQAHKELGAKIEQVTRELAAERQSTQTLVDRKTQLERDLAEASAFAGRAEQAATRVVELEVQLETLQERADDLESSLAVSETSRQATVDDERTKTKQLQKQLASEKKANDEKAAAAERAAAEATETIEALRTRLSTTAAQLQASEQAQAQAETALRELKATSETALRELKAASELAQRDQKAAADAATRTAAAAADAALREAHQQIEDLVRASEEHRSMSESDQDRLDDALHRAREAESRMEGLVRSAEAADLAIGRAGALQRQLDEAIAKLAWLERDLASAKGSKSAEVNEAGAKIDAAENRARAAEDRAREGLQRFNEMDRKAREDASRVQTLEVELQRMTAETRATENRFGELEKKLTEAERRVTAMEQRAISAEQRAIGAEADAASAGVAGEELDEARDRIAELEAELLKADNVRSFAAETEREIAQLQRDLRDTKGQITRLTLENDRLSSELRDSRDDSDTMSRPVGPQSRPSAIIDNGKFERENALLKKQLESLERRASVAEERLAEAAESTHTGSQLPLGEMVEQVSIIEESIDSLRSNMRAASDETAMMAQTESVVAVSSAVSQAAEHIERARTAIRLLLKTFNP